MLITICYSVLTWVQSRYRSEISRWVEQCLVNSEVLSTLVFIRDNNIGSSSSNENNAGNNVGGNNEQENLARPASASSFYATGDSMYSSGWSTESSRCSSALSTPRHETPIKMKKSISFDLSTNPAYQISTLCYNHIAIKDRRLLWQDDGYCRILCLQPKQIVELHDWTAFKPGPQPPSLGPEKTFRILLEAEPGAVKRHQYRKFSSFGTVLAWRWWGSDLALILESVMGQMVELMYIFKMGQIVLEGGWRVYRLTTVGTEGSVGTLITRPLDLPQSLWNVTLTPAELRRLSAISATSTGPNTSSANHIYRPLQTSGNPSLGSSGGSGGGGGVSIPSTGIFERITNLSNHTSRHDITTINESEEVQSITSQDGVISSSSGGGGQIGSLKLQNFYERSPRKRSVANIYPEKSHSTLSTPRRRSFCPGILSSKSASLASLLSSRKSQSVEEEDEEEPSVIFKAASASKSHESLSTLRSGSGSGGTPVRLMSPTVTMGSISVASDQMSPTKMKTTVRIGKPPNILVLAEDAKKRVEIGAILKNMLANDRYVIYDIRWDQLDVGGWSEQTALLVVSGHIGDKGKNQLLQFLGDGGRLLSWCCDTSPFGPGLGKTGEQKIVLEYGKGEVKTSQSLQVSSPLWSSNFQKIVETNDSEGYSRPLTTSVWAKAKNSGEPVVLLLDGGSLGGKALVSRIEFDKDDEGSTGLLSAMLTQHLGLDCTQIKPAVYTPGYLLGDHMKIQEFLSSIPPILNQNGLSVEFVKKGEKAIPSQSRLPVHSLECPSNFSTLEYYENLETKELGRLVIYADCIASTHRVFQGQSLKHGLVVVARTQTNAKGRGSNIWLSPEGCAVFSFQLIVPLDSPIGRRLSLIQHVCALAVILAVPEHREIDLLVKWPNDIYAGFQKMGGVLVESKIEGSRAVVTVGIGFNVANPYPTVCLNSLLFPNEFQKAQQEKASKGPLASSKDPKKYWTIERLIARTLTQMERILDSFDDPHGIEDFLQTYEDNWIHSRHIGDEPKKEPEHVRVEVSEGNFTDCRIVGIDEFGFLKVIDTSSANVFSVRPDGNSFDIANRLIAMKR